MAGTAGLLPALSPLPGEGLAGTAGLLPALSPLPADGLGLLLDADGMVRPVGFVSPSSLESLELLELLLEVALYADAGFSGVLRGGSAPGAVSEPVGGLYVAGCTPLAASASACARQRCSAASAALVMHTISSKNGAPAGSAATLAIVSRSGARRVAHAKSP